MLILDILYKAHFTVNTKNVAKTDSKLGGNEISEQEIPNRVAVLFARHSQTAVCASIELSWSGKQDHANRLNLFGNRCMRIVWEKFVCFSRRKQGQVPSDLDKIDHITHTSDMVRTHFVYSFRRTF